MWFKGFRRNLLKSVLLKFLMGKLSELDDEAKEGIEFNIPNMGKTFSVDFADPGSAREAVRVWRASPLVWIDSHLDRRVEIRVMHDRTVDERNGARFMGGLWQRFKKHMEDNQRWKPDEGMRLGNTGKPFTLVLTEGENTCDLFVLNSVAAPSMRLSSVDYEEEVLKKYDVSPMMADEWINSSIKELGRFFR